jgi:hypothetical protein
VRGRTNITKRGVRGTKARLPRVAQTGANRDIGRGSGKRRGDRVDTSKTYAGSTRRQPNNVDPTGPGSRKSDR